MPEFRRSWKSIVASGVGLMAAAAAAVAMPSATAMAPKALRFEPMGDGGKGFVSKGPASALVLDGSGALLELGGRPALRMRFAGAATAPRLSGTGELAERRSYFLGRRERWRAGVPQYAGVRYAGVYPGIDLLVRIGGEGWEYDFAVAPGADPGAVRLRFEGASRMVIGEGGDLVFATAAGKVRHSRPRIFQEIAGRRVPVAGAFAWKGRRTVGFRVGAYDRSRPLIIDPAILFAAEGTDAGEAAFAVAVDPAGATYLAGFTGFDSQDVFVTKLDAAGTPVYTTYLGGSALELGLGIAVDAAGNAYLSGQTDSPDFPVTPDALQTSYGDPDTEQGDAFLAKLDAAGNLVYASYFGGDGHDEGTGIALDGDGNIYLTGETDSFDDPNTPEVEQAFPLVDPIGPQPESSPGLLAYATKLSPAFSILFSMVIPGTDIGWGIVADAAGDIYVAGETAREDLPASGGAQPALGSPFQSDGFVVKLQPAQGQLAYATYLGGANQDGIFGLAVDGAGQAYVTGLTLSTDFPVQNPFQPELANTRFYDAFAAKLNASGSSLVYSTYLGGSVVEEGYGIAADAAGNAYVTGETFSAGEFPILRAPQRTFGGGSTDAFLIKLDPAGVPVYSTYLGDSGDEFARAVALDAAGEPRVAGYSESGWFAVRLDNSYTYNPAFTPADDNVIVEPEDATTQTKPVTLTFASVVEEGETSLATSSSGPAPPTGFQLGAPPTYYELSTTATFAGAISICIRYAGVSYADESQLTLQHFEGGAWTDVTTSLDTAADEICGTVTSLSPFAILEPAAGGGTFTAAAIRDSFLRAGSDNTNEGANLNLVIRADGKNRALVTFGLTGLSAPVSQASLRLYVVYNADNWGNAGRTLDAHRVVQSWTEGDGANLQPGNLSGAQFHPHENRGDGPGVTWKCAVDGDVHNQAADCDPRWDGGAYAATPTASVTIYKDFAGSSTLPPTAATLGWISFDVTADVNACLAESVAECGWLIRKTEEGQPGRVEFASKEGAAALYESQAGEPVAPQLVVQP